MARITKVDYSKFTTEQKDLLHYYLSNEMRNIKNVCNAVIYKKGYKLPMSDYDDVYSDAMNVLVESISRFDPSKNTQFKTFLTHNITMSYDEWYRDNYLRGKRSNLEKTKEGRIKRDKKGRPIIIWNVSFDEPDEYGDYLKDKIADANADKYEIEEDGGFSPKMEQYLSRLSKVQMKILKKLSDGYGKEEIQKSLHIDEKLYKDSIMAIRSDRNTSCIRSLLRTSKY